MSTMTEKEQRANHIAEYFKDNDEGVALAKTLSYVFNSFGSDRTAKDMAEYTCRYTHKTIQQSIVRGMFIFLRQMGNSEYYDARNEAAVKASKIAMDAVDNSDYSGLPLI